MFAAYFAIAACDSGSDGRNAASEPGSVVDIEGGSPDAADVPAIPTDAASLYKTLDDLPECDAEQPSLACIKQLFLPLGHTVWPFDGERVMKALGENEFSVAPGWQMSAHHVLEANLTVGEYGCFFEAYRYAEEKIPFSGSGCGTLIVAGGHPHALACKTLFTPMENCVDEVSFDESFDLVVHEAPAREAVLDLASNLPSVGDEVFVVGYPGFPWLSDDEHKTLAPLYPLVSYGHVVRAKGRGIVATAAVYGGNSGGPMLNATGQVIGVLSTKVGHQRARGTTVPAELADRYAVATAPDAKARATVQAAR